MTETTATPKEYIVPKGYVIGRLLNQSRPYGVFKDGELLAHFSTREDRDAWLCDYAGEEP